MQLTDTHAHLYLPEFDEDRDVVIGKAIHAGIETMLLPNIDAATIEPMLQIVRRYPGICYPMIGIHPTHVQKDFRDQLKAVEEWIGKEHFVAVGETGIDLYWDKTYKEEQMESFRHQISLSLDHNLPLVIHMRDSFEEVIGILDEFRGKPLKGVFHAFTGHREQAQEAIDRGFKLGIGGIVTFRNSDLRDRLRGIDPGEILLETDSPYLAPVPKRGKRNESSYLVFVAEELARVFGMSTEELGALTSKTARELFRLTEAK